MSCPATSSITTNCGSLRPLRPCHAGGGRNSDAESQRRASESAAQAANWVRSSAPASHHRRTVAAEPQVPGPGMQIPDSEESGDQRGPPRRARAGDRPTLRSLRHRRRLPPVSSSISSRSSLSPCLAPATRSRSRRWPICPDRSGGSGRCRRETRRPWWSPCFLQMGHFSVRCACEPCDFLHDPIFRRFWRPDRSRGLR